MVYFVIAGFLDFSIHPKINITMDTCLFCSGHISVQHFEGKYNVLYSMVFLLNIYF